jgi:hypothetical protein
VYLRQGLLRQSIKKYARSQYAPLLTRVSFEVHSSQLDGQILTKNMTKNSNRVDHFQGHHFIGQKKSAETLHNVAKRL